MSLDQSAGGRRGLRALAVLAVVTVIAVIAAGIAINNRIERTAATGTGGGLVFARLGAQLDQVAKITVASGGKTYEITRSTTDEWINGGLHGYPARFDRVRDLLTGLATLSRYEAKTARVDRFKRLNVDDPKLGAGSTGITLADESGSVLADLIVGKTRAGLIGAGRDGVYIRLRDEDRAWLAEGSLGLERDPADWSDRTAMNIAREDIATVTLTQAEGSSVTVARAEQGAADLELVPAREGRKLKSRSTLNGIGSALETVTFDDVRPAAEADLPDPPASLATFTTFDGLIITLRAGEPDEDGRTLVRFAAEPAADASDETKQQAAEIEQRFAPWAYVLGKFRSDKLRLTEDDLLEPVEAAESDDGSAASN